MWASHLTVSLKKDTIIVPVGKEMSAATNPITSMAFTIMTLGCKEQTIKAALESETTTINAQKKN